MRLPSTIEYVDALSRTGKFPGLEIVQAIPGNRYIAARGTWAHPKLAIFFARWLDVRFAVWCDAMIEDILKGNAGGLRTCRKFFLDVRPEDKPTFNVTLRGLQGLSMGSR